MSLQWLVEREGSRWTTEPTLVPPAEGAEPNLSPLQPLHYRIFYSARTRQYTAVSHADEGGQWLNTNLGDFDSLEEAQAYCEENFKTEGLAPSPTETQSTSPPKTPE